MAKKFYKPGIQQVLSAPWQYIHDELVEGSGAEKVAATIPNADAYPRDRLLIILTADGGEAHVRINATASATQGKLITHGGDVVLAQCVNLEGISLFMAAGVNVHIIYGLLAGEAS